MFLHMFSLPFIYFLSSLWSALCCHQLTDHILAAIRDSVRAEKSHAKEWASWKFSSSSKFIWWVYKIYTCLEVVPTRSEAFKVGSRNLPPISSWDLHWHPCLIPRSPSHKGFSCHNATPKSGLHSLLSHWSHLFPFSFLVSFSYPTGISNYLSWEILVTLSLFWRFSDSISWKFSFHPGLTSIQLFCDSSNATCYKLMILNINK